MGSQQKSCIIEAYAQFTTVTASEGLQTGRACHLMSQCHRAATHLVALRARVLSVIVWVPSSEDPAFFWYLPYFFPQASNYTFSTSYLCRLWMLEVSPPSQSFYKTVTVKMLCNNPPIISVA